MDYSAFNQPVVTLLLESQEIDIAVALLRDEQVVILPTETVYGLAGDACSDKACEMIYALKHRPQDNPLIVHCSDLAMVERCCDMSAPNTQKGLEILKALAPAPVTVVLSASDYVSDIALAGQSTVALRIPDHALCRRIIQEVGRPLAAPSANRSGMPSATNALMAWNVFYGTVPAVVNGGICNHGLESTIIDCTQDSLRVLREGAVHVEDIAAILRTPIARIAHQDTTDQVPVTPGMKYRHYAPHCKIIPIYFEDMKSLCNDNMLVQDNVLRVLHAHIADKHMDSMDALRVGICTLLPIDTAALQCPPFYLKRNYSSWDVFAQHLYEVFTESDTLSLDMLCVVQPHYTAHAALHDRIARASRSD